MYQPEKFRQIVGWDSGSGKNRGRKHSYSDAQIWPDKMCGKKFEWKKYQNKHGATLNAASSRFRDDFRFRETWNKNEI